MAVQKSNKKCSVNRTIKMLRDQIQHKETSFTKIALPTAEGFELIPASHLVIRCEADDNYTHIFLKDKTKIIACRTLKDIEEQLADFSHYLCSQFLL